MKCDRTEAANTRYWKSREFMWRTHRSNSWRSQTGGKGETTALSMSPTQGETLGQNRERNLINRYHHDKIVFSNMLCLNIKIYYFCLTHISRGEIQTLDKNKLKVLFHFVDIFELNVKFLLWPCLKVFDSTLTHRFVSVWMLPKDLTQTLTRVIWT